MRKLLRRTEIKFFSCLTPGLLFKLLNLFTERLALTVEQFCINQRSGPLHTEQHPFRWELNLLINTRKLLPRILSELHREAGMKRPDCRSLLDAAPGCLFGFHLVSRFY